MFLKLRCLLISFLPTTLKQMEAAKAKLKSTRKRHSLDPQEVVNRRLAAKKQAQDLKRAEQMDAESSIASPSAGTRKSPRKKRKGVSSTSSRKSARVASRSETGQEGKKLGSLMEEAAEEAADSKNVSDDDDDEEEDRGSNKKRSGKK